jgi:hypothetical protein
VTLLTRVFLLLKARPGPDPARWPITKDVFALGHPSRVDSQTTAECLSKVVFGHLISSAKVVKFVRRLVAKSERTIPSIGVC